MVACGVKAIKVTELLPFMGARYSFSKDSITSCNLLSHSACHKRYRRITQDASIQRTEMAISLALAAHAGDWNQPILAMAKHAVNTYLTTRTS